MPPGKNGRLLITSLCYLGAILCIAASQWFGRWGPKPQLVRWLSTTVIKPRITYGCLVWGHTINQDYKKKKLKQLNQMASLIMAPKRRNTPTLALEILNNLLPLDLHIRGVGVNAFTRLNLNQRARVKNIRGKKKLRFTPHLQYWDIDTKNALGNKIDEETTLADMSQKDYTVTIDNKTGRKTPVISQINVYTDGSKTGLVAGSGYVIMKGQSKRTASI